MRLNLDAGELPDEQPALWAQFHILNIACGGHAGDTSSMTRLVEFCVTHAIAIGAHPSYPDREHFGRRSRSIASSTNVERAALPEGVRRSIAAEELHASLVSQLRSLSRIAAAQDARVEYAKPHGALYHDASRDPALADIVVDAIRTALDERVTVIGPRGHLASAARAAGLAYAIEGFADRAMRADGSLVPRSEPGALITSPATAVAQALALARGASLDASVAIPSPSDTTELSRSFSSVDTICVHADTPGALEIARAVRAALAPEPSVGSDLARPASVVALGDRAIRFTRPRSATARALVDAIRRWPGVVDVVIARHDIAAYFARPIAAAERASIAAGRVDLDHDLVHDIERAIGALANLADTDEPRREVELRAVYDGPDLDEVARACGLATDEVVRAHVGGTYEVDTLGFAPGFAYLTGLDPRLHLPRRSTPRDRVPAGALAIASEYTAVYPFASPGGWRVIGHVEESMFDTSRGARLQLGDRVRFTR